MPTILDAVRGDPSGAASVLLALAAPPLIGMAALSIDLGSLYLAERRLQNLADAAAASAVSRSDIALDAEPAVQGVIEQSGQQRVEVVTLLPGHYDRDTTLAPEERFTVTEVDPNAVEVRLKQQVDFALAGIFLGDESGQVVAFARAAKTDLVAFELNTKTVSVSGGVAGAFLSALLGRPTGLSDDQLDTLLSRDIDVYAFSAWLRDLLGDSGDTLGEALDQDSPLDLVLEAMAAASDDPGMRDALETLASQAGGETVRVGDLIDLGPLAGLMSEPDEGVRVDAYGLLRSVLETSKGDGYDVALDLDVAGLGGATVRVAGGRGYERSPWLTITSAKDVVLRTGQTRVYVEARSQIAGVGQIRVPLYVELAPAEASIAAIECDRSAYDNGVRIDTRPSLGEAAVADVDLARFADFGSALALRDARLVDTALIDVDAYADVDLGGAEIVPVRLSLDEIERGVHKEAGTPDLLATTIASLLSNLDLQVSTFGLGLRLPGGGVRSAVGTAAAQLAPALDQLLGQVTDVAGAKLGVAQVGVTKLRCGRPMLVA